jgi:type 1 glutamine amidotransferase
MRSIFYIAFFLLASTLSAQNIKVLHYTETSGFDHRTREVSLEMLKRFSNLSVTDDQTGETFSNIDSLLSYDVIIFSNTSGDKILDQTQQENFETYIDLGGNLMGIHAASDTYRHSSANGGSKGSWDFYAETLGGSVQQNPNHVRGTPFYNMYSLEDHATLDDLPDPWGKNEEYYYWENGFLDSDNNVVLEVETTVGPNGMVNSYDSARAVSWYKVLSSGSKVFYTSMGHASSNFTSDTLFQRHIENAIHWCSSETTSSSFSAIDGLKTYPNPSSGRITLETPKYPASVYIFGMNGNIYHSEIINKPKTIINIDKLPAGVYILELFIGNKKMTSKFIRSD